MSVFDKNGPKTAHGKINKLVTGDGRIPFEKQLEKKVEESTKKILGIKKKRK